ncbi:MAG: hypothetical protein OHK0040_09730 [bacterium]
MEKRVLLVEDDTEILTLLSLALGRVGYIVEKATDYREALEVLGKETKPDVILMDYYLPEVDGISLARTISDKNFNIPVILFTAAELEQIKHNMPPNIIDTIKKPFNIDDIIEKLDKTIKMKNYFFKAQKSEPSGKQEYEKDNLTDLIFTEKAESLKNLLSQLSHHIKNALQTISTNIELLEKGYIEDKDRVRCFNSIKKKIEDIRNDLDVLKHPQEFNTLSRFSLKNCIRDVLHELRSEIKKKDVYIKTDFMKKLPLYNGKKGCFYVMFKDLINFLIDCIPEHGRLEISLSSHQQEYFLEIYQSGIAQECDNTLKFFDMKFGEKGVGLTRTVLNLKELKGKIDLSISDDGVLNIKITFPMH